MKKSVCIIGAGIGGLTAGAYLAREGYEVTVIEKATTVGGSAGMYIRKNRIFPTGATIAFGLEEGGVLNSLLRDIGVEVCANMLKHPMDVVVQNEKISVYQEHSSWEKELARVFPANMDEMLKFWQELHKLSQDVLAVTKCMVAFPIQRIEDLGTLPRFAIRNPKSMLRLARYANWTIEDLMKKFHLEHCKPLREFLDAQLLDATQTDVTQSALLPSSLALSIYRNGSFSVENGIGEICNQLARRIEELNGKVLLASPVQKLYYDAEQKKWQVESRKCTASFDIVMNSSGVSFGPRTSYADHQEFSWGAFRIDGILSSEIRENSLKGINLPFAVQIVPKELSTNISSLIHAPIYVTFHETKNKEGQFIDDEITMTISVHADHDAWSAYSKEEYKEKKIQLSEAILTEVNKVIPIKEYIQWADVGTPLTYKKFIGKTEVGGFPLTVKNAILKPKSVRSSLPQLYIVGEQVFPGPGTLSSALSGYYAARAVMRKKIL